MDKFCQIWVTILLQKCNLFHIDPFFFRNPTPEESISLNNTLWPAINPDSSDVNYLAINESISQQVNPKQDDWNFYVSLWETYNDSTTTWTTY